MGWLGLIKSFVGQKVDSQTVLLLILEIFAANDGTKDHLVAERVAEREGLTTGG
jgi:hypothetical protein